MGVEENAYRVVCAIVRDQLDPASEHYVVKHPLTSEEAELQQELQRVYMALCTCGAASGRVSPDAWDHAPSCGLATDYAGAVERSVDQVDYAPAPSAGPGGPEPGYELPALEDIE